MSGTNAILMKPWLFDLESHIREFAQKPEAIELMKSTIARLSREFYLPSTDLFAEFAAFTCDNAAISLLEFVNND